MDKELKVVISAEDNATAKLEKIKNMLGDLGDKTSDVSSKTNKLSLSKNELGSMMTKATAIGFALVEGLSALANGLSDVARKALDSASAFQQQRIAFDVLLKSEEKGAKMMKDLAEFAEKTPFNIDSINEASVRLLAYGVEHEKILPLMTRFGDIASLVGNDKLPNLIRAYGQARNSGKLMLEEVNQLTDAGVPILETLTKVLNQHGGVLTQVGGSSKEVRKEADKLNNKLEDQTFKLKYMEKEGDKNTKQYKNLKEQIKFTKAQIKDLGPVSEGSMGRVMVKTEDMRKMIEKGNVSFEDLNKAFEMMTSEGGLYYKGMEKQGRSFGAIMEQTNEKFMKFLRSAVGMEETGDIKKGGILFYLQESALKLTSFLDAHGNEILEFLNLIGQQLVDMANSEPFKLFVKILTDFFTFLWTYRKEILSLFEGIVVALTVVAGISALAGIPAFITAVGVALAGLSLPITAVIAGVTLLYLAWDTNFLGMKDATFAFFKWVQDNFPRFTQWVSDVWNMFARFIGWVWDNLFSYLLKVWERFSTHWKLIYELFLAIFSGDWKKAFELALKIVENFTLYVNDLFVGLPKMIADALANMQNEIVKFIKSSFEALAKWAGEVRDKIKSAFDWNKKESPSYNDLAKETEREAKKKFQGITKGLSMPFSVSNTPSSNTPSNVNINFNGNMSVRSDEDINKIALEVKRIINREDVLYSQGII